MIIIDRSAQNSEVNPMEDQWTTEMYLFRRKVCSTAYMVVQWLVFLPYSQKVNGAIPGLSIALKLQEFLECQRSICDPTVLILIFFKKYTEIATSKIGY